MRLEDIGYAVVLLPLLIGLWAHATVRKGVLRVLGAARTLAPPLLRTP